MRNVVAVASGAAENTRFELVRQVHQIARSTRHWLTARHPSTLAAALKSRFLPYLLTFIVCWLPWLMLTWPGSMRDDTVAQYLQASGIHHYYTQHPLFDTLTFGLFWHLGESLDGGSPLAGQAIYTAVQAALLAAGAALSLCYIRKLGAPRWLIALSLIYLATSYVVVGSVTTMGKDSLHTVFFLPLAVVFSEICLTRGRALERRPVAIVFVMLLFAAIVSKRTALMIVLCAGCGLLAVCRKGKPRLRAFACLAVAILLAQAIWSPLAAAATHASQSPGREVWGLITQPVAQVAHDHPNDSNAITAAQRVRLNAVMDLDRAAADISPHRTNETFATLKEHPQPTTAQKLAALRTWVELGLAHPADYAKAYAGPIRAWWNPMLNFAYPTDSDYLFTPGYLKQWATFLPEGAANAGTRNEDRANADVPAAERIAAVDRDLASLMGTSHKPQWQQRILKSVHRWVRKDNPLTAMALYVTWIPLAAGLALLARAVAWRAKPARRGNGDGGRSGSQGSVRNDCRNRHDDGRGDSRTNIAAAADHIARPAADVADSVAVNRAAGPAASPIAPALASYGLLFFTVLSLYASPEALFWYPIPVYFTLPLFTALPFAAGRVNDLEPALAPTWETRP